MRTRSATAGGVSVTVDTRRVYSKAYPVRGVARPLLHMSPRREMMKRLILFAGVMTVTIASASSVVDAANSSVSATSITAAAGAPPSAPRDAAAREREITLPAGTVLPVTLETPVGSDISRVEQPVTGRLRRAVTY